MSILQANGAGLGGKGDPGGALGGGGILGSHTVSQSLRLNGVDAYLSRAGSDLNTSTNTSKRTFSTWFKTSTDEFASQTQIYGAASSNIDGFGLTSSEKIQIYRAGVNTHDGTRLIRDTTAWYHFLYLWNHTDGNYYFYINGELDATGSTSGAMSKIGNSGHLQTIGKRSNQGTYINGYLAETVFLDGYIGSVSDFGETVDGVWVPKNISSAGLTYGANGFYLDYADSSDLGKDVSGQGNHFTSNNISAEDQVADSPTNNFATMNTLNKASTSVTLKEGGLATATMNSVSGSGYSIVAATMALPRSGQWYWEADFTGQDTGGSQVAMAGLVNSTERLARYTSNNFYSSAGDYITWYGHNNNIRNASTNTNYTSAIATQASGTISFAVDMDNLWVWVAVNGTWINGTPDFSNGTNKVYDLTAEVDYLPFYGSNGGSSVSWTAFNFGQGGKTFSSVQQPDDGVGEFEYTVPTGYKALCTLSLPDITIGPGKDTQADDHFNTVLYTGDGSTSHAITGVGFQPDWVWIKRRNNQNPHFWNDSVRGATKDLNSSGTDTEETNNQYGILKSFDSDGFTVSVGSTNGARANTNTGLFVAWNWKLGGNSNTFNIDGTGYSSASDAGLDGGDVTPAGASINTAAGVSIITYTGNGGANQTIEHGLSSVPLLTIIKDRDSNSNGNNNWWFGSSIVGEKYAYFTSNGWTGTTAIILPTSGDNTTVTIGRTGTNAVNVLENGDNFVMYNFTSIDGFSKVGKYIGNGNADGTFVFTGFRPAWLMVKNQASGEWCIVDAVRDPSNEVDTILVANSTNAESDYGVNNRNFDFLSNGFKLRATAGGGTAAINNSGASYIYLAFAESPFKYANAR